MRYVLIVLWMLFGPVTSAVAQVSIGIGLPGVNIGINLQSYPQLVQVPGYPVYYASRLDSNFFFYDGAYWVYERDNWYASSWYNGPWGLVGPEVVPLYVLRIPVRYYRDPPEYFRGWRRDAPPRWGNHWGRDWEQHRRGWDKWDRKTAPAPAPLPVYQRKYAGDRYPQAERQRELHSRNYRYRPRDAVVRKHYEEHAVQKAPVPSQRKQQTTREERSQRVPAAQEQRQQPQQGAAQREQQAPMAKGRDERPQGKESSPEPKRSQGQNQEKGRAKGDERGQERNK